MKKLFLLLTTPWISLLSAEEGVTPSPTIDPAILQAPYQGQFIKTFIALVAIVLGIFIAMYFIRRFSYIRPLQMNHQKNIKILEKRPISPSTCLYHIQVGDKQFVLSESKLEVRNVAPLNWKEEISVK